MASTTQTAPVSKTSLWIGRTLSALAVLLFLFTAGFALLKPAVAAQGSVQYGYPDGVLQRLVIVEIACAILYAIPRTSVLGAILLTGYLGGATATHVRVGEPPFVAIIVGIVVWLGLYLRDERLRALVPLRKTL
jgi:DoxX-like family